MKDRFSFKAPESISEAQRRKRQLETEIADIGRQLSNPRKKGRHGKTLTAEEYTHWRVRTRHVLVVKEAEQKSLKDWISRRRRQLQAASVGVEDPQDPIDLLLACRGVLDRARGGDTKDLGRMQEAITQFLNHEA